MTQAVSHPLPQRPRLLPPALTLLAAGMMWVLNRFAPILEFRSPLLEPLGIALIALGGAIVLWSAWEFRRAHTSIVPFTEPTALITRGPYRVSRNPIYAGFVLALLGVASVLGSLAPYLVLPAFFALTRRLFIQPEEQLLENRFGSEYLSYKQQVRRWI